MRQREYAMIFEGTYRRFIGLRGGKAQIDARITHQESLAVGGVEPPGFEMTRAGRRFFLSFNGTVPTGIAPVQAFPTTAAQWALSNNDSSATYFFKALGALLFSGTSGLGGELLACIFQTPAQQGFAAGLAAQNASNSSRASKVSVKSGVTITVPALPNWFPVAEQIAGVAQLGPSSSISNRQLEGRIALPPGFSLGLAVLAPAGTTPLYLPIAEWIEQETDLE
jgi:hypothetical protein